MRALEILKEEHFLIERTMKVLNRLLITENFNHEFFDDFFLCFYEILLCHLVKEKTLFLFLNESADESLIKEIERELVEAKNNLEKKSSPDFSLHIEEFILLFSRHIFLQENGPFLKEDSFSPGQGKRLLSIFYEYDRKVGSAKRDTFLYLLDEMERKFG